MLTERQRSHGYVEPVLDSENPFGQAAESLALPDGWRPNALLSGHLENSFDVPPVPAVGIIDEHLGNHLIDTHISAEYVQPPFPAPALKIDLGLDRVTDRDRVIPGHIAPMGSIVEDRLRDMSE